jgi:hypothetical protein
MKQSGSCPV